MKTKEEILSRIESMERHRQHYMKQGEKWENEGFIDGAAYDFRTAYEIAEQMKALNWVINGD